MRRFIALVVMLIVPLQFAWSAAGGMHGHTASGTVTFGIHLHEHDHHDAQSGHSAAGESGQDHCQDGHHPHCHPVFSAVLMEPGLSLDTLVSGEPCLQLSERFLSRTPSPLERPPLARA